MNARKLVQRVSGPLATVYCCPFCTSFRATVRKGFNQGAGRGYGLREGSKAHAAVVRHIHEAHASKLEEVQS